MDAEKVEHIGRKEKELVDLVGAPERVEAFLKGAHVLVYEIWLRGDEADELGSIGSPHSNAVLGGFPAPADRVGVLEEVALELEDEIRREPHGLVVRVYRVERIAVAGDLLFRAVPRARLLGHDLAEAFRRGGDALDSTARFDALDDRGGPERFEDLGHLLSVKLRPAPILPERTDCPHESMRKREPIIEPSVE